MNQYFDNGSVTSVKGFTAAGIACGIKRKRKDLALIVSEYPCNAAGTFTLNKVKAAPLLVTQAIIKKGNQVKAVLINSGNANACTGEQGYKDALEMQKFCADKLKFTPEEVLIASTGVIGQRMPMDTLKNGISQIVPVVRECGGVEAAEAIMTTDTTLKHLSLKLKLKKETVNIGAISKGSGMIAPNMATMLCFITTDAEIDSPMLQQLLSSAVNISFNKTSVDGETSTNDMVILLANGASKIKIEKDSEDYNTFKSALEKICIAMAKAIVSDGEGATKLVTVNVKNAKTQEDADLVAKSISTSYLVKTAIYGADANWGRIISAAGHSGAEIEPEKVSISFEDQPVLLPKYNIVVNEDLASKILSQPEFSINVDLGIGDARATWWTCDLTEEYVRINSDYRS
jgi:glutamate N-acetyltransferase / amino-acid N-acetyltransferase